MRWSVGDEFEDDGVELLHGIFQVVVDDSLVEVSRRLTKRDFVFGGRQSTLKRLFGFRPTTAKATLQEEEE